MIMTAMSERSNKLGIICRICLKGDGPMASIFTENENQPILATKITSIAQVQVSQGDGLPVSICRTCHQRIDKFYDFRLLVEISDRALRAYLVEAEESEKASLRDADEVDDSVRQPYPTESNLQDEGKNIFAVNTILVPSESGTEVWRICSVDGDSAAEMGEQTARVKTKNVGTGISEYTTEIVHFNGDVATEANKSLLRKVQPVAIVGNLRNEEPIFFTMTTNNEEIEQVSSEPLMPVTNIKNENNGDANGPYAPLKNYSCQLCLKSFKTLRTLKGHVKDHFLCGKRRIQICEMGKKKVGSSRRLRNDDGDFRRERTTKVRRTYRMTEEFLEVREEQADESEGQKLSEKMEETDRSCEDRARDVTKKCLPCADEAFTGDSSLACTTCNKHFRNSQSFKMHLKRHTLGNRFNCHECGKGYYSNSELARHAQLHTGMREYPCYLCDMSFFSRPELNRHTKYHNGEKKFQCKICLKTYYESGHLKVHERVHTGEKPFSCTVCEKAFITKSKLMRHCKIHEKDRAL